ncbi:Clavaminate synthase-like protein [Earliella scabrosa]|nr:Clavaminate synthase-like protein [Earliella scabrosa]
MVLELACLPVSSTADASTLANFGREVKGLNLSVLNPEEFEEIQRLLYKHGALLFRNVDLTPEQQYQLTKAFDPTSEHYGHGNNKTENDKKSILNPLLKTIPRVPQVQLIGNGTLTNYEGLAHVELQHSPHRNFHKTHLSPAEEAQGYTRFYRWHMDAALYDLSPPKATSLYAVRVPVGPRQRVRYDDGSGDELEVSLGTTAFVDGRIMFAGLPEDLKSVAVRTKVRYAPHPFVWMAHARAVSTGLGLVSEGLEVPYAELPPWEEVKVKVLPMLWKNPVTGELHLQTHPCAACELLIDPLPVGARREGALYPDGAHLTDLKEIRDLLYKMQRPGIAPHLIYAHDWQEKDLILFHNRGVMHTAVGSFTPEQVRAFHQCNLAASDDPEGPSSEDVKRWA